MLHDARLAITKLSMSELLVTAETTDTFVHCLSTYARMSVEDGAKAYVQTVAKVEQMYGVRAPDEIDCKPFIYNDGMAIIPVHGVLMNRFSSCWGFVTGYNFIRTQLNAALDDDDVTLIVFDVDSPGGDAAGCFELTEEIRASRDIKPSIAVVDDLAASGGYAIPAAATRMVATPSSSIGSIGVYRMTVDMRGADEREGVKIGFIVSEGDDFKLAGSPHVEMTDEVREWFQIGVDARKDEFVADVMASRGLDDETIRGTKARVYRSQEALAIGLIDAVSTPTQAVSAFLAELAADVDLDDEDDNMALPKTEAEMATMIAAAREEGKTSVSLPDTAQIARDAVAADRARREGITSLDEAKDRPALALKLADTDSMTADIAKGILAVAAVEKTETVDDKGKGGKSAFEQQMDSRGGAKVAADPAGGDDALGGGDDKPTVSASIIAMLPKNRVISAAK